MIHRPGRIPFLAPGIAIAMLIAGLSPARTWSGPLTPTWITEGDQPFVFYGRSVASAGDVNGDGFGDVIVGAYAYYNPSGNQGRVFVYHGSAGGLSATPAWVALGTSPSQTFGYSVAGAGDVNGDGYSDVIIGTNSGVANGQAWVYEGSAGGLGAGPAWSVPGVPGFGTIVAGAGDVNGDGYSDVVVARASGPNDNSASVWVFLGSASGLSLTPVQTLSGLVSSVASAGDVNGDGYDDLIVGHVDSQNFGAAEIHLGSASGPAATAAWFAKDVQPTQYGFSVAGAGDVNGDGFDDFLVSEPLYDSHSSNLTNVGRAYLYFGSAGVPDVFPDWTFETNQTNGQGGNVVAGAGDVNGDGYDDVLVASVMVDYGQATQGRAYLFFGTAGAPSQTPDFVAVGDQPYVDFAVSMAGAGDVNGDGGADLILGADWYHHPDQYEGRAYVYTTSLVGVPHPLPANRLALAPPFPNPSRGRAEFAFSLPSGGRARLTVHDVMGRTVATLVDGIEEAGPHRARWDAGAPSGVYVARLEFAGRVETRRIAVTR